MKFLEDCVYQTNEEFLMLLEEFESESERHQRARDLCRMSGYLRFLFFETLHENVQDARGGDLRTLICGIPLVVMRSVELCESSANVEERELACDVMRDTLYLALIVARKFGKDEGILNILSELIVKSDQGSVDEISILAKEFSSSFIKLFR
ncbi:hypothetical protein D9Q81_04250 [Candidatus Korarchaeum cryptofilum]|uniref:Uncharacterized protein n=1 Tax=Candidatus Korarchaeum cryptofilum TaxID=498846 RepID=A0A429G5A8_9CREN|nr:hypothetical protein [Candidatus Korarchaeum cryptofilum]RSN69011.1 hypothetical protein D9Q81_04250 [Candidatus Korarchaeum cryptofilum]